MPVVKNRPANAGDLRDSGSIPGLGRSPGEGNGNPLQYSCLENPLDRGAWQATEHTRTHAFPEIIGGPDLGDKEEKGLPTPQVPLSQQSPGLHPGQNIATVLSTWPILTSVSPSVK